MNLRVLAAGLLDRLQGCLWRERGQSPPPEQPMPSGINSEGGQHDR